MGGKPTFLLAFANDQGRFLDNLRREANALDDALFERKRAGHIEVEVEQGATIDRLFTLVGRYADDLALFHYGGHANGTALDLEAGGGGNATAHGQGLASLLGSLPNLKLAFLNGCATQGHVEALLKAGVPAVIATSAPVEDDIALAFASQFYAVLGETGAARTIEQAFERARSLVETAKGAAIAVTATRGMSVGDDAPPAVGVDKWGLYVARGKEATLAWTMPTTRADAFVIETAIPGNAAASIATPNSRLIARQAAAVNALDPTFSKLMATERELSPGQALDELIVRKGITNSYPAPIGEQLRKLFAGGQLGEPRLRLLVDTYGIATRFVAFTLLAQVWDLFEARPGELRMDDAQWQAIEAFNALGEDQADAFDFVGLAITLTKVIAGNGARPFMSECEGLEGAFATPACSAARTFMNRTREALARGTLDEGQIAALVEEADEHLEAALDVLTFVVSYKLTTIKQITISKQRNRDASYIHQRVLLGRMHEGQYSESQHAMAHFAANQAVILVRDLDDVSSYINLSPFMIDQNALTGAAGTKLYFLRWYDAAADVLHFGNVSEDRDRLEIRAVMPRPFESSHPPMLALYKEYRAEVARR